MYKAIIIDDEEMARTLLKGMIAEYCENVDTIELCKYLPTGVKAIRKHKPDIVFLDIEMPGHSGLELLDFFDENEINFSIIFVTAYNHYAIQAFKLSAIDYLLKPIEVDDLKNAINLFEKNNHHKKSNLTILKENLNNSNSKKKIALNTLNSYSFVELSDILYFQGDGSYTKVFLKDGKMVTVSKGLKNFETLLNDSPEFFRCHKSYLVNINHITEYIKTNGGYLRVDKTHEIGVSSDKVDKLLKKIAQFIE
jgi:two-component system LytT family response regulator